MEKEIVTFNFGNEEASNTFLVESRQGDSLILTHPLAPNVFLIKKERDLNTVPPSTNRDSVERGLGFVQKNRHILDYFGESDLECLCIYFVVKRVFSLNQKKILANLCGKIAIKKLSNNLKAAMQLIKDNEAVLDEFNLMWYHNFRDIFSGKKPVYTKKQRESLFNMAGFVLAELETPSAPQ